MPRIDLSRLRDRLNGVTFVRRLVVLERVESTNDEARRLAAEGAPAGTVVLAETQTAGRGRLGRTWYSPPADGLYLSVLLRPARPAGEMGRWSIMAAAAACLACREAGGSEIAVEWPNDVVWRGLKVAGTLVESRATGAVAGDLVIGTGFNVGQRAEQFPEELRGRAASLRMAGDGAPVERESLAAAYLRRLGALSAELERGSWESVLASWLPLAPNAAGRRVRVVPGEGGDAFTGTTRGLDASGALRVERDDGPIETVRVADAVLDLER